MIRATPKHQRVRDPAKLAWIRTLPCLFWERDGTPDCGGYLNVVTNRYVTEACHVRSRGAGGGDEQVIPMCGKHHHEQHQGIKTFQKKRHITLKLEAQRYHLRYLSECLRNS